VQALHFEAIEALLLQPLQSLATAAGDYFANLVN